MIGKIPKTTILKTIKKSAKVLFVVEAVAFVVSYGLWSHMNRSREFRGYMNENFPSILEGFYKLGEVFDHQALQRIRANDTTVWEAEKKSQKN